MEFNKSIEFRLILKTITLAILLFTLRTEAAPTANSDESVNITSHEEDTTVHIRSSKDHPSGNSYLDEAYEDCVIAKDTTTCVKYGALKYINELTSLYAETEDRANKGRPEIQLWGPIKLIPLPPKDIPTDVPTFFSDLDSRSTDSEPFRFFRFILRETGRFVGSYALAINIPTVSSSGRGIDDLESPKFIDDDVFSGGFKEVASRGKKKTLMYLLPLVSFFHLKALLVPILLAVLFIKKVLVLGIVFLPSLLSLVKLCKPQHHHYSPWMPDHEPPTDYHAEYSPHYESSRMQESEDHRMIPDGWTESKTYYPAVKWSLWDNTLPEDTVNQVWRDSNVSPSVVATTKETVTSNTFVADKTRELISDEFLDQKPKPKWMGTEHDAEETNEGIHYGPAMSHAWDDDIRPHYQEIRSIMHEDFLRIKPRDAQRQKANPEQSNQHRSTSSLMNQFPWGKDLGSTDTTISDKKTAHKEPSFGEFKYMINNWPEDRNSKLSDSSAVTETEENHSQTIPVDPVTGKKAMSDYLRSFSSSLHVQSNHTRGEEKKKCDQDNDSSIPTADTEYDTDKETLATKAHISRSYSVLRNHKL